MLQPEQRHETNLETVTATSADRRVHVMPAFLQSDNTLTEPARILLHDSANNLQQHPDVERALWNDLDKAIASHGDTVTIAVEFCPLYVLSENSLTTLQLAQDVLGQDSIQKYTGTKWEQTLQAIRIIKEHMRAFKKTIKVQATFADRGVLVATSQGANPTLIEMHATAYAHALAAFAEQEDISVDFQRLSDLPSKPGTKGVEPFVIMNTGRILERRPSVEEVVEMIKFMDRIPLTSSQRRKRAGVLLRLLDGCGGNIDVLESIVRTYLDYEPSLGADIHIGVERTDNLLSLAILADDVHIARIPKLNLLVKRT